MLSAFIEDVYKYLQKHPNIVWLMVFILLLLSIWQIAKMGDSIARFIYNIRH